MRHFSMRLNKAMAEAEYGDHGGQKLLADESDVSRQTICSWVNGEKDAKDGSALVHWGTLLKVANVLDVSAEWLMTGVGPERSTPKPLLSKIESADAIDTALDLVMLLPTEAASGISMADFLCMSAEVVAIEPRIKKDKLRKITMRLIKDWSSSGEKPTEDDIQELLDLAR